MTALALLITAILLAALAPRMMARWTWLRRSPRAALYLWQSMALAGVLSALAAGPVAMIEVISRGERGVAFGVAMIAVVASGFTLSRLVIHGHLVGRRLRGARREQRTLVDLVGTHHDRRTRIVPHESVMAYCVPGLRQRVVLSEGTLRSLPTNQLDAVLAHERAHLRERHDLVLEFFTVLHLAAPDRLRAPQALHEVRLLVEVLADRSARKVAGDVHLGRALISLAGAPHPAATLGASHHATATRIHLLNAKDLPLWLTTALHSLATVIIAVPLVVVLLDALG